MKVKQPGGAEREAETTTAVMRRLQRRDPTALGELYDLYGRLAFLVIVRIVRDSGIAEDLVQETFWCVWRRASLFDADRGAAGAWLLVIARNRALDYLRSPACRYLSATKLKETEDPKLFTNPNPDALFSRKRSIDNALGQLGANQRVVIELAYFEGYSQSEIALKTGHPLGTVKTWFRSALKTLREQLEGPDAGRVAGLRQADEPARQLVRGGN